MSFFPSDTKDYEWNARLLDHSESTYAPSVISDTGKPHPYVSSFEHNGLPTPTNAANVSPLRWIWNKVTFRKFRDSLTHEEKKSVSSAGLGSALWKFCYLHLPAIAATLGLLSLYVMEVKWEPPHPAPEELVALLFAAKVHEILILISLGDILLHRIRYGLLRDNGMPLGFISSAFQLSSPAQYLLSWEFWGTVRNPTMDRYFHAGTAAVILILALVGLSASPLSGTAMIPRPYWYNLSELMEPPSYSFEYIIGDPYFMELDSQHAARAYVGDCSFGGESCQDQRMGSIWYAMGDALQSIQAGMIQNNLSLTSRGSPSKSRPISLSATSSNYSQYDVSLATGPPSFVSEPLGIYSTILGSRLSYLIDTRETDFILKTHPIGSVLPDGKWKQPIVAVDCQQGQGPNDPTFNFNSSIYNGLNLKLDFEAIKARLNLKENVKSPFGRPMFLDVSQNSSYPISATILYSNVTATQGSQVEIDFTLCLIQARWVETEMWAPVTIPATYFELPVPQDKLPNYLQETSTAENVIKMKNSWLTEIGFSQTEVKLAKTKLVNSAYGGIFEYCQWRHSINGVIIMDQCIPIGLALYFADALTSMTGFEVLLADPGATITLEEARSKLNDSHTIIQRCGQFKSQTGFSHLN